MIKCTSILAFVLMCLCEVSAQTPPNPTADMNPGSYTAYNSGLSIAANFNAGRRFEETNKGLATNLLGTMTPPSNYNSMTLAQKTLFIVNSERACRNIINYGSGALTVKPIYGIETNLSSVAQGHADWMMANNAFEHCGDPALRISGSGCSSGKSSVGDRIQSNNTIKNGWESWGENIGYSVSSGASTFSTLNEQTIFDMLYQDAGSAWGHRVNFLKQYSDNYGPSGNEAFIGVAEKLSTVGTGYQGWAYGKVIVYDFYDPQTTASNAFTFSATLPVEWLSVSAERVNGSGNNVRWKVGKEINNAFFTVERSADGRFFNEIGTVKGAGNSEKAADYAFLDDNAPNQNAYYRVKQTDFDGKIAYSKTVAVAGDVAKKWRVYPNPAAEKYVNIDNQSAENTVFSLQNAVGQVVKNGTTNGESLVRIDLNNLPKGVYFLKMRQQIEKIIVQ